MKTYAVYIKSHCSAPDYEDKVLAGSKDEAIEKFLNTPALMEWDKKMLADYVEEVMV